MLVEKGIKTGLDISPLSKKIEITSNVVDGQVLTNGISFGKITNYIVQNEVRVAETDDRIENQADRTLFVDLETIGQERATQLNDLLVAIFEENFIKQTSEEVQ